MDYADLKARAALRAPPLAAKTAASSTVSLRFCGAISSLRKIEPVLPHKRIFFSSRFVWKHSHPLYLKDVDNKHVLLIFGNVRSSSSAFARMKHGSDTIFRLRSCYRRSNVN